ncbi:energy transducer TonB [Stenotrophomonas sp.]|uniref:energy transducer TonB n=1 Tax=Stenotrophomonas sp. TaxID=69392 RepID=UPI002FC97E7B
MLGAMCLVLALSPVATAMAHAGEPAAADAHQVEASIDLASKDLNPARYPDEALRAGHEGEAVLLVRVDAQGAWIDAVLIRSSGYRALDQAALDATRHWTYRPGMLDGVARAGEVRVTQRFTLDD